MILASMLLLFQAVPAELVGASAIEGLYAAASSNDEPKFRALVGQELGFFAAPDFVLPMRFKDFQVFAKMCAKPVVKSSSTQTKNKQMLTTVSFSAVCEDPKTSATFPRGFDVWITDGKVIAIRPEGMK